MQIKSSSAEVLFLPALSLTHHIPMRQEQNLQYLVKGAISEDKLCYMQCMDEYHKSDTEQKRRDTDAPFMVAKRWTQPKCSAVDEWVNKTWYIFVMECYSAMKKNGGPIYATTWTNLGKQYAKCKKPGTKDHILYYSIYVKFLEQANLLK